MYFQSSYIDAAVIILNFIKRRERFNKSKRLVITRVLLKDNSVAYSYIGASSGLTYVPGTSQSALRFWVNESGTWQVRLTPTLLDLIF